MAAPQYSPGTLGNFVATGTSLAAAGNFAALLDCSPDFEAQLTAGMETGGTVAATAGVTVSAYHTYGAAPATTLTSSTTAGTATVLPVASASGIKLGQYLGVDTELCLVTAVSGLNITVSKTQYAHASSANVYLIEQSPSATVQLSNPTGAAYAINSCYSKTLYLPTSKYWIVYVNLDATNAVTIEGTLDLFTAIQ